MVILFSPFFSSSSTSILTGSCISHCIPVIFALRRRKTLATNRQLSIIFLGKSKVVRGEDEILKLGDHLSKLNYVKILAISVKAKYVIMRYQAIFF